MTEAIPALNCHACGGPVDGGARTCRFCGASVATVRCARCFHMSLPSALHCEGCGYELGLEPIPENAELSCPDCKVTLDAFAGENGRLYDCARCGGQFVETALLHDLLERRAVCGGAVPRRNAERKSDVATVRYVPCAVCSKLMGRKNFGGHSGVIIDVCRDHGVWFDVNELPRVLEFVEQGGLAEERRRELAEMNRQRAEMRAAHVYNAGESALSGTPQSAHSFPMLHSGPGDPSVYHSTPSAWSEGLLGDAHDVVVTVLDRIGQAIAKRRQG
ncbi:MAG TPA: zf-TFIIB domain-containing protein [Polyangiaceae bacterium]|jgi:Zn-finger nucleic acid-binding protein|nr:zf-TFIIB domain-containing protein [Polyangiaceae bacterium]